MTKIYHSYFNFDGVGFGKLRYIYDNSGFYPVHAQVDRVRRTKLETEDK